MLNNLKKDTTINPNAVIAFNKDAEHLLEYVVERPITKSKPLAGNVPEVHTVATITAADIIGDICVTKDLPTGERISRVVHKDGKEIALEGEGHRKFALLAEKLQARREVKSYLSVGTIESHIFDWTVSRHLKTTSQPMLDQVLGEMEKLIVPFQVWVPVFGIYTRFSFELGRAKFYPLGKQFFDTWENRLAAYPTLNVPGAREEVAHYRGKLQGLLACTFDLEAESKRAQEIALEEAENALAILRVFMPTNLHPNTPSYCRPYSRENLESSVTFCIRQPYPPARSSGVGAQTRLWVLDEGLLNTMSQMGLGNLNALYLLDKKTEFQEMLFKSIMTYSRSSLQLDPSDRLIYIFTALDSLLLENDNQNIQQNIAERIAFTISHNIEERIDISKTVIKAYGMRSQAIHHNQRNHDLDLLVKFLNIVSRFYMLLISRNGEFKTRQDFFDAIMRMKFSGMGGVAEDKV